MDPRQKQFQKRVQAIQQQIRSHRWDALWLVSPANRQYVTGFSGSAGWVLISGQGQPTLITDGRYQEQAAQQCPWTRIIISRQDPHQFLIKHLTALKIQKLGFEDEHVPVRSWRTLQQRVKGLKGGNASGFIEAVRICKDQEELKCLQQAIRISEKAFARILPKIKVRAREIDIALQLEKEMVEAGASGLAFPTIIASGPNGAMPHAQLTQRKLKSGDLVVMDFGCKYQGYHSDLTRTIAVAKMTTKQQEFYEIVKNAQVSAQKEMISGNKISEADKIARNFLKKANLSKYFIHSLGHGIGLEIHEAPKISLISKDNFDSGMIVTCEPGIYLPGWGGIRIEDDVLVCDKKALWLSRSSDHLILAGRK